MAKMSSGAKYLYREYLVMPIINRAKYKEMCQSEGGLSEPLH